MGFFMEVTIRIELIKYGFANRPVSHSGTSPRNSATSYWYRCSVTNVKHVARQHLNAVNVCAPNIFMKLELHAHGEAIR